MDYDNSHKLIISSAVATINGDTIYTYGTIYYDSFAQIEGEFNFPNLNKIYATNEKIESIIGKTDNNISFEIFNPISLSEIFPNTTHKVVINQISLYGNFSLKPDLIECQYKNSRTTDSDEILYKGEKYQLSSFGSTNRSKDKGKIGTMLSIEGSKLPIDEIEELLDTVVIY